MLKRTTDGRVLASVVRDTGGEEAKLWTVEHFHVEVAKVLRRDVLAGVIDGASVTELAQFLAEWPLTTVSVAPLLAEPWELRNNLTSTTPSTSCWPAA
jgi:predicted nucleic acid-binding protein